MVLQSIHDETCKTILVLTVSVCSPWSCWSGQVRRLQELWRAQIHPGLVVSTLTIYTRPGIVWYCRYWYNSMLLRLYSTTSLPHRTDDILVSLSNTGVRAMDIPNWLYMYAALRNVVSFLHPVFYFSVWLCDVYWRLATSQCLEPDTTGPAPVPGRLHKLHEEVSAQ